jgi:hypothetical protein
MKWSTTGCGGQRRSPEHIKRDGWREQNILVVSAGDERLTWTEREFVRLLGDKLYWANAWRNPPWINGRSEL